MRCQHSPVREQSKLLRSVWNEDPDSDRCARIGYWPVRGRVYCRQHRDMWQTHWRIVDRIRAIPIRR